MSKIFYGVAGEGRGHAARALAVLEALSDQHELVVYANGHAPAMLDRFCESRGIQLVVTPDVAFRYTKSKRLSYVRTLLSNSHYLNTLPQLVNEAAAHLDAEAPDLVISDFEPVLPRAAKRVRLPFLSLSHQHFLLACDLSALPFRLQTYAKLMAPFVSWWYEGQAETVVSSFFQAPLRPDWRERASHVGVMLRREIREASTEDRGHLVAYVRRNVSSGVIDALHRAGRPTRVYGLGSGPSSGTLTFHEIDPHRFLEDMATSTGVVSTAGNQLVGEALYLGKPVLAMPEVGNREQEINAFFLERGGGGWIQSMESLTPSVVQRFVQAAPELADEINRQALDGLPAAVERIEAHLDNARRNPRQETPCIELLPTAGRFGAIRSSAATSHAY